MLITLFITLGIFAFCMLIMSVGVLFSNRCLRGSCGGPDVLDADGNSLSCDTCPRRKKCEDEADQMLAAVEG